MREVMDVKIGGDGGVVLVVVVVMVVVVVAGELTHCIGGNHCADT